MQGHFYEATGIKLPTDSRLTNYNLLVLNNKNRNINNLYTNRKIPNAENLTLTDYVKHIEKPDSLTGNGEDGIIESSTISGARDPYKEKAEIHAVKYYGLVRAMKTDVSKIAKTTGLSEEKIQKVKNFIFYEKHDLGNGYPELFKPDFMMGESWRRLINGTPEPHDITLINHEIMELELMENGYTQSEAHILATQKYNYGKEAVDFYDKIKKYKD